MNKRLAITYARDFLRCIRSVAMRDGIFTHDYKTEKAKIIERQARLYRFSRESFRANIRLAKSDFR